MVALGLIILNIYCLRQKRVPVTDWNSESRVIVILPPDGVYLKAQRVPQGPAELSCSGVRANSTTATKCVSLYDLRAIH